MIETVTSTGSTNADLAARLARGEAVPDGTWLVADRQLAGKGRQGRDWIDGQGNFTGSTVVNLRGGDPPAPTLSLVAGLAVHEAVATRLPPPHRALLKWPNDLMLGAAKLAGILLERVGDAVIVGIGVNLAQAPDLADRATVALSAFTPAPDRDAFAADLARLFALELERWRLYGLAPVIARWQAAGHPPGTPLLVGEPGEVPLSGTFAGLTAEGTLQLRLADGTCRAIHAGDVRLTQPD
ncbi:MAG: biotin--[acetyl-CoA-carboxylase] ligase [Sphingomonadales bacterium]|nr:biotin--[acetyl-CoA-carboxylase] ligase [Sphingomonadales bacterium]